MKPHDILRILADEPSAIATRLISVTMSGAPAAGDAEGSQISDDGSFVIFSSDEADLAVGGSGLRDVFLADRDVDQDGIYDEPGQTSISLLSVGVGGAPGDDESGGFTRGVSMSADASIIVFESLATNMVLVDANGRNDVFLQDVNGNNVLISMSGLGEDSNDNCENPVLSGDGRWVGHACYATNLLPNDINQDKDVFRFDRVLRRHEIASVTSTGVQANGESEAPATTP